MFRMTAAVNVNIRTSAHPQGGAAAADPHEALHGATALPTSVSSDQQHDAATVIPRAALDLRRRAYTKGEYLYDVGQDAHAAYIVEAGLVALTLGALGDRQRVVALAGPGDVIGALTPNLPEHQSGAVALSGEVSVRVLPAEHGAYTEGQAGAHTQTHAQHQHFAALLSAAAGDQIARLTWALEDSTHPVPARIARALLRLGRRFGHTKDDGTVRLTLPITHDTLASLVGAARETTTYTVQQLREKGLLAGTRGNYQFHPTALQRFADEAVLTGR